MIVTGNPIVWTAGALAIVYMAVRWIKDRRLRSPEGFVLVGFAFTYLPWFIYQHAPWVFFTWGRVATFIFYFLPALPFVYLALGFLIYGVMLDDVWASLQQSGVDKYDIPAFLRKQAD